MSGADGWNRKFEITGSSDIISSYLIKRGIRGEIWTLQTYLHVSVQWTHLPKYAWRACMQVHENFRISCWSVLTLITNFFRVDIVAGGGQLPAVRRILGDGTSFQFNFCFRWNYFDGILWRCWHGRCARLLGNEIVGWGKAAETASCKKLRNNVYELTFNGS